VLSIKTDESKVNEKDVSLSSDGSVGASSDRCARPVAGERSGNRYLLVMTDRFSKITRAAPMKGVTAEETAEVFLDV
jgi:hypothetical protein